MYRRLLNYLYDVQARQRAALSLARGQISRGMRTLDLRSPDSWEFSGFSQNGEDGIIEVLRSQLKAASGTFLEIGSADGVQNNTTWLALIERLDGVMVEGSPQLAGVLHRTLAERCIGSRFLQRFVTRENVRDLLGLLPGRDPDLFSLDIDGNDFHIATSLLEAGMRPKIVVVEYNSVFGGERAVTVPYSADFTRAGHPSGLYYGASLAAWRRLFEGGGYRFLGVERNGVNAFFADPASFDAVFLDGVRVRAYAENKYQRMVHGNERRQWSLIAQLPLQEA